MKLEYQEYSIADIATLKYGKMLSKNKMIDSGYPVYSGYRITGYSGKYMYEDPMLLVVARGVGGTGDVKISPPKSWITNLSIVLDVDPKKADKYYLCMLLGLERLKDKLDTGAAQSQITIGSLEPYKLRLPNLEYQKYVSEIIKTYDNLIENNNRRIAILEGMAQSLYREWFVNFRFPGHENTKFIDSQLGKIPGRWKIVGLQDICERITDGAHKSPKSVEDGVPMASVKDMHNFGLNLSTCRQISEEDYEELERQDSVVKGNDVLIAKDGSYLKHTFVVERDEKVALLSSIAMLRPNERVNPHWLAYCLRSENVKERMKQCVSGVAVPRIILKDFRQFKIILPPKDIQKDWNNAAEQNVKLCWNLIRKNENLKNQRDLLLPKLISGSISMDTDQ